MSPGGLDCARSTAKWRSKRSPAACTCWGWRAPFIARVIGGHLEVEDAAQVEAGVVGGKVRASNLSGGLQIGKIGGKLAADGVAGEVAVGLSAAMHVLAASAARSISKRWVARSIWPVPSDRQGLERRQPRTRHVRSRRRRRAAELDGLAGTGPNPHLRNRRRRRSSGLTRIMFMVRSVLAGRGRADQNRGRTAAPT